MQLWKSSLNKAVFSIPLIIVMELSEFGSSFFFFNYYYFLLDAWLKPQ